jgi:general stress protein 26
MADQSADAKSAKLWSMIKDIGIAMMTTDDEGQLRSRPMAARQAEFDGTLWFFTRADSHKVDEVVTSSRANVSYADPVHQNYVSLSGSVRLVRAPEQIRAHWSEAMRPWFPKGSSDPDIALLKVDVERAEYWDAPSSTMVHVTGYAKALLTGQSPHPGDHEKLQLS